MTSRGICPADPRRPAEYSGRWCRAIRICVLLGIWALPSDRALAGRSLAAFDAANPPSSDPVASGWEAVEIQVGLNALQVTGESVDPVWQINDQNHSVTLDSPAYQVPIGPDLSEMYRQGWEFTFTVRAVQGNATLAGFVGWTVPDDATNPGWTLGGASRRVAFYLNGSEGGSAYLTPDQGSLPTPGSPGISLGSSADYHTIRAVGIPQSTEFLVEANGTPLGTFDFANSFSGGSEARLSFGSGSSGGTGLVCHWKALQLSLPDPDIHYVDWSATGGGNDGSSWGDAYLSLPTAFANTSLHAGDEVWVAEGTYDAPLGASFHLPDGVAVFGGFPPGGGDGTMGARNPNPATNATVLNGNGNSVVVYAGANSGGRLDGLTITGGDAQNGGGLIVGTTPPPGIPVPSPLAVHRCLITSNEAQYSGGGVLILSGGVTFSQCLITNNKAMGELSNGGGGIAIAGSALVQMQDCLISDNEAGAWGGGVMSINSLGITIERCTLADNLAGEWGGGVCILTSAPAGGTNPNRLENVTITGNEAPEGAGAWISSTSSDDPLAMFSAPDLRFCTIAGNFATTDGGGLSLGVTDQTIPMLIEGCVVAQNTAPGDGPDVFFYTPGPSSFASSANLIGIYSGTDNLFPPGPLVGSPGAPLDPLLAPLGDYGGLTPARPPLPGSPAIEPPVSAGSGLDEDQLSNPRPGGSVRDLGAVEALPLLALGLPSADGDLIPDVLEGPGTAYPHLDPASDDSGVDADGDGSRDEVELSNMTNPLDSTDFFRILSIRPAAGFDPQSNPAMEVKWVSFPGLDYRLASGVSPDLLGSTLSEVYTASDFTHTETVILPAQKGFARVHRE